LAFAASAIRRFGVDPQLNTAAQNALDSSYAERSTGAWILDYLLGLHLFRCRESAQEEGVEVGLRVEGIDSLAPLQPCNAGISERRRQRLVPHFDQVRRK